MSEREGVRVEEGVGVGVKVGDGVTAGVSEPVGVSDIDRLRESEREEETLGECVGVNWGERDPVEGFDWECVEVVEPEGDRERVVKREGVGAGETEVVEVWEGKLRKRSRRV